MVVCSVVALKCKIIYFKHLTTNSPDDANKHTTMTGKKKSNDAKIK